MSFVVLGLLATAGPQTSYDLAANVDISVRFFWPVTRSQLYAEPQRLEALGLLVSEQEAGGRRRRVFTITDAGLAALRHWLETPPEPRAYHDPAMLRLFLMDAAPDATRRLADARVAILEEELAVLEHPEMRPTQLNHRRVLEWGRATTRADLVFWRSVRDETQP